MSKKVIFHIDMNAYFCSCEEIINPSLKGKAFSVGSTNPRRGVISTASYEARKYGINSGMSTFEAKKKYPNLLLLGGHYEMYGEYSRKFMNIFKEYTSLVEQASIDEAYLDVTDSKIPHLELAKLIQNRVLTELGLPCSIGIGTTLYLAKMGSDYKKPFGITVIRNREVEKKLYPLPVKDTFGIGKRTYPRLEKAGILTIGDLFNEENKEKVIGIIGERGLYGLKQCFMGKSNDIIDPTRVYEAASIGNSRTYFDNLLTDDEARDKLLELSHMVAQRMNNEKFVAKNVTVQIRDDDFKTISKGKTFKDYFSTYHEIYDRACDLFISLWDGSPIRLLGITCSHLRKKKAIERELNLFNLEAIEKEQRLIDSVKKIEKKYGEKSVTIGIKENKE